MSMPGGSATAAIVAAARSGGAVHAAERGGRMTCRIGCRGAGEDGDEFISAEPGQQVRPDGSLPQGVRRRPEHGVARQKPVPFVHPLEADHVADGHGDRLRAAAAEQRVEESLELPRAAPVR